MPLDTFDPAAYDASGGFVFRRTGTLVYMPELTTDTQGAFVQLQHRFSDLFAVEGGTISFDGWTFNAGATLTPAANESFYASFSQGFQLPDIGLQLRNANAGFNIDNSDLKPVRIDSYELGWRGNFGRMKGAVALFRTTSGLGDVQSFNNGLILLRTAERIKGVEASLDFGDAGDAVRFGGSVTYLRGREKAATAPRWQTMTGYRIPPLKITAYAEYAPTDRLNLRLQGLFSGDRDYRLNGIASFGRREVESYLLVDLIARYNVTDKDQLTLGIENLLNNQYLPVYSQLLRSNTNTSRVPANGATLTVAYKRSW